MPTSDRPRTAHRQLPGQVTDADTGAGGRRQLVLLAVAAVGCLLAGCSEEEQPSPMERALTQPRTDIPKSSRTEEPSDYESIRTDALLPAGDDPTPLLYAPTRSKFSQLLSSTPEKPDDDIGQGDGSRGLRLMQAGKFAAAESVLRSEAKSAPQQWQPAYNLAVCLFELKRYPQAKAQSDIARQRCRTPNAQIESLAGVIQLTLGNELEAIQCFDTVEELGQADARTFSLRATAYLQDRDFKAARKDAERSLAETPDSTDALYVLAVTAMVAGNLNEARETLELARKHGLNEQRLSELEEGLRRRENQSSTPAGAPEADRTRPQD